MRLNKNFYLAPATEIAVELLGKTICHKVDGKVLRGIITETECYYGLDDTASHASKRITPRNKVMFSSGGVTYVYLCYGIHSLLNIVTGEEGHPEGVLIRGIEGARGPGLVTKKLKINVSLNNIDLTLSDIVWIEDEGYSFEYQTSTRIGIDYAEEKDRNRLWRFTKIDKKLK